MIEHRLIERMVALLKKEAQTIETSGAVNLGFINDAIDFFKVYADRCHHGKEEDILFKALATKQLSTVHKIMLEELLQDHARARDLVSIIDIVKTRDLQKDPNTKGELKERLKELVALYTVHIKKEDRQFFIPTMEYFSEDERGEMLCGFQAFDRMLIHDKYKTVVERNEGGSK